MLATASLEAASAAAASATPLMSAFWTLFLPLFSASQKGFVFTSLNQEALSSTNVFFSIVRRGLFSLTT